MHRIKNNEIFLVQISTRPFLKHIYRSLRDLLNSTLTRNEFWSFQTQTIHKIEGSKPCIYTFYTKTRQIHTIVQKSILFHTELNKFHTHTVYIPMSFFSFPYFFSSLLLLPFPSLFFSLFLFLWITLNRILKGGNFLPLSYMPHSLSLIFFFFFLYFFLYLGPSISLLFFI